MSKAGTLGSPGPGPQRASSTVQVLQSPAWAWLSACTHPPRPPRTPGGGVEPPHVTTPWWVHRHRLMQPNPPSQTGVDPGGPHFIWKRESSHGRGRGTHAWLQSRWGDGEVQGLRPSWTTSSGLETPRQRAKAAPSERSLRAPSVSKSPPWAGAKEAESAKTTPTGGEATDVQAWPRILLSRAEGPSLGLRTTSRGHTHATGWGSCVWKGAPTAPCPGGHGVVSAGPPPSCPRDLTSQAGLPSIARKQSGCTRRPSNVDRALTWTRPSCPGLFNRTP